ncbi:MAG: 50S ribosomal protein L35 [Lentisphaerae bacterium]|nr:50S ribosomal protein L35 [Lentisphaerota bacterium]
MPKHKTKKAVAKRFRKTATGKVMHAKAGAGHLMSSKSRKRKRSLRSKSTLAKAETKRVTRMLSG